MPTKTRLAIRPPRTPYKHLLPPLSSEELAALRASIQANGVLQPVILDELNNVLDGHNRLAIDPNAPRRVIRGLSEAEKRAFVFASNMARRNLSPAQKKAALAAMKAVARALREEDPKKNTQKRIAELLGVSRACVEKWFQRRGALHNQTCLKSADTLRESDFLADARITIPHKIRPAIVKRCESGEPLATIAADFKVAKSTISRIYRRHLADRRAAAQAKRDVARAASLGDQNIIVGDYRHTGRVLADGSVDLIFTDPPFAKQHIPRLAAAITAGIGQKVTKKTDKRGAVPRLPRVVGLSR
ncbi:MAG TPA: ParB N-terminal domain-containing protein [Pirellulales bacterium]|nr:ParB N-terminal domain-containing protein [Pirellulales bacterium]